MTRVLVLWADASSANLGVRALAAGATVVAEAAWGASEVVIAHQDFQSRTLGEQLHRRSVVLDRTGLRRTWSPRLADYDVVLDTGAGDSFSDIYGVHRTFVMTQVQRAAIGQGIPYVLLPQTVGPFATRRGKHLALPVLRRASLVMTRDSESAEYCRRLGRSPDVEANDLVFAIPQPQVAAEAGSHDVLLNVSGLLWSGSSHVDSGEYRRLVTELTAALLAEGRRVAVLPHVLDNPSSDNDLPAAMELAGAFGLQVLEPRDLEGVRALVASASLVVGSRMHACLNALSVGTPAVALAYSRKFAPLMSDLGWHDVVDLREGTDVRSIVRMCARSTMKEQALAVRDRAGAMTGRVVAALREAL